MTENTQDTQLRLNFVAVSDRGLVRGNNEDSAYAGPYLLALADGMGGHAAGEVASQLMVTHLEHLDKEPGDADLLALLGAAAEDGNAAIEASVREHPEQQGMGTTLTALMFNGREFGLIHAGDSRGYLLRDGALRHLTIDDTFVQSLVDEGKLNPEDVSTHPQKSLILKAYTGRPVEPRLEMVEAREGDRVLLCSDGLTDPVTDETIAVALGQGTPEIAAQRLIELALRSGGPDNVTVVVADVEADAGEGAASASDKAPAIVGALAPAYETSHPDSSAGRAAALLRRSESIEPDHNRAKTPPADADGAADDDAEGPLARRKVWPWVAAAVALVLIAAVAAAACLHKKDSDLYFLRVDERDEFVIEHGSKSKPEPLQHACIDERNKLRIVSVDAADSAASCHVFGQKDLPQSQQETVAHSDVADGGTYDEVLGLLSRLADEALPVCVDGKAGAGNCREVQK